MPKETNKYSVLRKRMKALKKQAQEAAQLALAEGFKEFFEKYPELETISWKQYTPYFNDGDPCTFSVYSDVDLNDVDRWDLESSDDATLPLPKEAYKEISEFVASFDEDDLEKAYGDHVIVTISRDGTSDIDDYHHD